MTTAHGEGFRAISVNGRRFRWRFTGKVVVVPDALAGRQILELDIGWSDPWLHVNAPAPRPKLGRPIVTPALVAAAIKFALDEGWNTETRGGRFRIVHSPDAGFGRSGVTAQQAVAATPQEGRPLNGGVDGRRRNL